jgi:hypothetical protein
MQALDNFIPPILGFKGDIPLLMILVSTRSPSGESASDPSARASKNSNGKTESDCHPDSLEENQKSHREIFEQD